MKHLTVRRLVVALLVVLVAFAAAGCVSLKVKKVVDGATGPFTVLVECERPDGTTSTAELAFNGSGQQVAGDFIAPQGGTCIVTEPDPGDANVQILECGDILPSDVGVTCQSTGNALEIVVPNGVLERVLVSVTITNKVTGTTPSTGPPSTDPPTTSTNG
jgi:hypothetical protein